MRGLEQIIFKVPCGSTEEWFRPERHYFYNKDKYPDFQLFRMQGNNNILFLSNKIAIA